MTSSRPRHLGALLGAAALTLAAPVLVLTTPAGAAPASAPGCSRPVFSQPVRAAEARARAPQRFADAVERNGAALARSADDRSLWLDRCGVMFYADPATTAPSGGAEATEAAETAQAGSPATAQVPLADTFTLASRPGASRTIWLDFRGGTFTGTAWNSSYGSTIVAEPYSSSAPADTAFSDAELTEIQRAWQVVAEDYAPFDVNVVLADPGTAAIDRSSSSDSVYGARVVMTNSGPIYASCSCGGIAYVGVFNYSGSQHMYYQPAWVFAAGTGTNGKNMGEAASHEVGHNFGLNHDGTGSSSYYTGGAPWAPIMGAAYSQPVSQFSRGEYTGASTTQDDLAVVATGAPVRADDHGNSGGAATLLTTGSPVANGVVTTRTDVDAFRFTGAGATTVTLTPASGLPNLDAQLTVLDSSGATVATVDPAATRVTSSVANGLGATWTATLPSGGATYTVLVDGVGTGDPLTTGKYSDYGSLGNYQVSLSTGSVTGTTPLTATGSTPPRGEVGTPYSATPVSASGGVAPYTWSSATLPAGLTVDGGTGTVSGTPTAAGTTAVTVTVTDSTGATASATVTLAVDPAPVTPVVADDATVGDARVGMPVSRQLTATGGTGSYAWSVTGGSLPPGLALSAAGTLSGTPTTTGSWSVGVTATSGGVSDAATLSVQVSAQPVAFSTGSTLPNASTRKAYSATITVSGGVAPYSWSRTAGALPPGLVLTAPASGNPATVSGRATLRGTFMFTLVVQDAAGATATRTFKIAVK